MSNATIEKPKSKVTSTKPLPSARKLAKKFIKHMNKCKTCKIADDDLRDDDDANPSYHAACEKGRKIGHDLQNRLLDLKTVPT